ncbi:hypothetical protein C8Q79DRAFT_994736 [Trametes meyenii]|nr:hypothetical protein C8Q79DRAFT_994736 [Trametes meyenii]
MEKISQSPYSHGLLGLPDEILLQIIYNLPVEDITSLRKTCTRLQDPTADRTVWLHVLRQEEQRLPLPRHLSNATSWAHLPSEHLESVVRRLHAVARCWLSPPTHYYIPAHRQSCALDPIFDNDDGARSIYSIEVFLDRWLLCIYHEKLVEIWDLDSVLHDPGKPILCTSHNVKGTGSFSSAMMHLDEETNLLTIAVSCHELCHVLQVQLRPSSAFYPMDESLDTDDVAFRAIADIPIASPVLCLRALDPSQSALLLSLPSSFHLVNWETGQRIIVHMLSEEEEELWNGVVGATFLTSRHILVLKAHSIEICTLLDTRATVLSVSASGISEVPTDSVVAMPSRPCEKHMRAMVHSHYLSSTTFRGASFAKPIVRRPAFYPGAASTQDEPTKVSTSFLAFDVLRGLFHFSVEVTLPSASALPQRPAHDAPIPLDVHIELLSSHNMALPLSPLVPTDGTATPTNGTGTIPRSLFSHGTRGFVSSCALGPAGRRGVWVERRRGAVRRVVYGFDATNLGTEGGLYEGVGSDIQPEDDMDARSEESNEGPSAETTDAAGIGRCTPAIDGREVYEVNSYDLRDDITHIAFAEATGVIVLGTRKGEIRVLGRAEGN